MDSRPEKTDDPLVDEPAPADEGGPEPGPAAASRERLCQFLRAERDRAALTIGDIARVTRIPEHSLRRLEAGQFEDLPADVFVRGFLRSYARCVGVDADDVVRRYDECGGLAPAPVASDLARAAAEQAAAEAELEDRGDIVSPRPPAPERSPRAEPAGDPPPGADGAGSRPAGGTAFGAASDAGSASSSTVSAAQRTEGAWLLASRRSQRRRDRHARGRTPPGGGVLAGAAAPRGSERRHPAGVVERRRFADPRRPGRPAPSFWTALGPHGGPRVLAVAVVILVIAALLIMSSVLRWP